MRSVVFLPLLGLSFSLLAWDFSPSFDTSCGRASFSARSLVLFAPNETAALVVGGFSFAPLVQQDTLIHASLSSAPYGGCVTGGELNGTVVARRSGRSTSWDATTGTLGDLDVQWTLSLVVTFSPGCQCTSSPITIASTKLTTEGPAPFAQMKASRIEENGTRVVVHWDQPVSDDFSLEEFTFPNRVVAHDLVRLNVLEYAFWVKLEAPVVGVVPVFLLPAAVTGVFGRPNVLGKLALLSLPKGQIFNPPLFASEDLSFFNGSQTAILVAFGTPISGLDASCFNIAYRGTGINVATVTVEDSDIPGCVRIVLSGVSGEGSIDVSLKPGCINVTGLPVLPGSVTVVRDTTAPKIEFGVLQALPVQGDEFEVDLNTSEAVVLAENPIDLIPTVGGATMPRRFVQESPTRGWINVSACPGPDLFALLNVVLRAHTVSDLAGNTAPGSDVKVNVRVILGIKPPDVPTQAPEPPTDSGALTYTLVAVGILAVIFCVLFSWRVFGRNRRKVAYASVDVKQEFEDYGLLIFDQYAGREQEYMTHEHVVQYSLQRGYTLEVSEEGARKLLKAAGNGEKISREEWLIWLRRKVTRGNPLSMEHLRELQFVFPVN